MEAQYFWPAFGAAWIFVWVLIGLWARQIRTKKHLAIREMIHRERLAAIEKGTPLPELEDNGVNANEMIGERQGERMSRQAVLVAGLLLTFIGIGIVAAFLIGNIGSNNLWAVGFIPFCAGIGMLLFPFVERFLN